MEPEVPNLWKKFLKEMRDPKRACTPLEIGQVENIYQNLRKNLPEQRSKEEIQKQQMETKELEIMTKLILKSTKKNTRYRQNTVYLDFIFIIYFWNRCIPK